MSKRNFVSHATDGYELPVSADLAFNQSTEMRSTGRLQVNRNKFESYIQLMDLHVKLKILRLMEYASSSHLRGMSGFYGHLWSRFPLVTCLRRPA